MPSIFSKLIRPKFDPTAKEFIVRKEPLLVAHGEKFQIGDRFCPEDFGMETRIVRCLYDIKRIDHTPEFLAEKEKAHK